MIVRTIIAFLETSPSDKRKVGASKKCPQVQPPIIIINKNKNIYYSKDAKVDSANNGAGVE